jgi:hypothetical protein
VFDPNRRAVLEVGPQGQLRDLTMAGIFFESREPPSSEFSFADLTAAFPEGEYAVKGESFDGTILVGSATFTHDVPAPPTITSPEIADEPRGTRRNPVSRDDLVVGWDRVTKTVAGSPVNITGYEVIVTKEVADDPHGFSRPTLRFSRRPHGYAVSRHRAESAPRLRVLSQSIRIPRRQGARRPHRAEPGRGHDRRPGRGVATAFSSGAEGSRR